jgi:hypothetical protein
MGVFEKGVPTAKGRFGDTRRDGRCGLNIGLPFSNKRAERGFQRHYFRMGVFDNAHKAARSKMVIARYPRRLVSFEQVGYINSGRNNAVQKEVARSGWNKVIRSHWES